MSNENKYAILMETSGEHNESWLNFIKFNGNEEALQYIQKQLKKVEMFIIEDMSTFDLELDSLVSEQTAREMCQIDLNPFMSHRKFDGKLKKINFDFSKRDKDERMIEKVHEILGYGDIDKYIDDEDFFGRDPDDFKSSSYSNSNSDSNSDSDEESGSDEDIEKLRRRVEELSKKKTHTVTPVLQNSKKSFTKAESTKAESTKAESTKVESTKAESTKADLNLNS